MEPGLISVVIATYNGERFILSQLESVGSQTYPNVEIIVSDDGSTDRTLAIVEEFRSRCPTKLVVRQNPERRGYSENFLSAVTDLASGDYIAFCDQDDIWHPEKLRKCHDAMVGSGAVMCAHALQKIDQDGQPLSLFDQGIRQDAVHPPRSLEPWGVYFGLSTVFRRSILEAIPIGERGLDVWKFTEPLAHDRWIYFLADHLGQVATLAEPLASYRQHDSNLFGHKKRSAFELIRHKVSDESQRHRHLQQIALGRVAAIRNHARPGSPYHADLVASLKRWETIAHIYGRRADLVETRNVPKQLSIIADLLTSGHYAPLARGGIGRRKLMIDVLYTCLNRFQ